MAIGNKTPGFFLAALIFVALSATSCVIDSGSDRYCQPELDVGWQIQDSTGAAVTCGAAGATTVTANVNGLSFSQSCPSAVSSGTIPVPLQRPGGYDVTVTLFGASGSALTAQSNTFDVQTCGAYPTTPAPLTVPTPTPAQ